MVIASILRLISKSQKVLLMTLLYHVYQRLYQRYILCHSSKKTQKVFNKESDSSFFLYSLLVITVGTVIYLNRGLSYRGYRRLDRSLHPFATIYPRCNLPSLSGDSQPRGTASFPRPGGEEAALKAETSVLSPLQRKHLFESPFFSSPLSRRRNTIMQMACHANPLCWSLHGTEEGQAFKQQMIEQLAAGEREADEQLVGYLEDNLLLKRDQDLEKRIKNIKETSDARYIGLRVLLELEHRRIVLAILNGNKATKPLQTLQGQEATTSLQTLQGQKVITPLALYVDIDNRSKPEKRGEVYQRYKELKQRVAIARAQCMHDYIEQVYRTYNWPSYNLLESDLTAEEQIIADKLLDRYRDFQTRKYFADNADLAFFRVRRKKGVRIGELTRRDIEISGMTLIGLPRDRMIPHLDDVDLNYLNSNLLDTEAMAAMAAMETTESMEAMKGVEIVEPPEVANRIEEQKNNEEFAKKTERTVDLSGGGLADKYNYDYLFGVDESGNEDRGVREHFSVKEPLDRIADYKVDFETNRTKIDKWHPRTGFLEAEIGYSKEERPGFTLNKRKLHLMVQKRKVSEADALLFEMGKNWLETKQEKILNQEIEKLLDRDKAEAKRRRAGRAVQKAAERANRNR